MVLLVHPDHESFLGVEEESSTVGPVPSHAGGDEQRRHRLVVEKMLINPLLNFLFLHVKKRLICSGEVSRELRGSFFKQSLNLTTFSSCTRGRKAKPTDGSSSPNTRRSDVILVECGVRELLPRKIRRLLVVGSISVVS